MVSLTPAALAKAAAAAGTSRESAYRLRDRREGALFAALWDLAFEPDARAFAEVHSVSLSDGRLMRLLSSHFRRERGDFANIGKAGANSRLR